MPRAVRSFSVWVILIASLSAIVFLPGLGGGFVFDDRANIIENSALQSIGRGGGLADVFYAAYSFQPGGGSRALTMLSFALDSWRGGGAYSFKSTNLLIHVLTCAALAVLIRGLLLAGGKTIRQAECAAVVLAFFWAIHPLQVSSVLYVVQRMQTLVTLFMVLALWSYLSMRRAQMRGERSRRYGMLTLLFGALGFASKEDALLLPVYMMLLELTLLGFKAQRSEISTLLRRGYISCAAIGAAFYLLWVVPHYWHWGAYPGRDFSSYERLLTQARVLMMYLWQSLVPLPDFMRFYYDDYEISRGLFSPVTTFASVVALGSLLIWGWCWRLKRPVFSFGVFLFFAGHIITSNIINLEMVFEHRNQLPLIGVVLAVGELISPIIERRRSFVLKCLPILAAFLLLAGGASLRAYDWGEPLRFARKSVEIAPLSERAWLQLASVYADRSGMDPSDANFDLALAVCVRGEALTGSIPLLSNVIIYSTMQGHENFADFDSLVFRMSSAPMSAQNKNVLWVMLNAIDSGVLLDERGMLRLIDVVAARSSLAVDERLRIAAYIHNETHSPGRAFGYLRGAVELSSQGDPSIEALFVQLKQAGLEDWVIELKKIPRTGS